MSSFYVTTIVLGMLALLVGYAFIAQALEKRRQQRQRLATALRNRQRNFSYMVTGFPPGFLTRDLSQLVLKTLLEITEQLAKLEPRNRQHKEEARQYEEQLKALSQAGSPTPARLESPGLAVEIRQHLQELYRFVAQQQARQAIPGPEAAQHLQQIKTLIVRVSLDEQMLHAREAQRAEKPRLELHHCRLAQKLLVESNDPAHQAQAAKLGETIQQLEQQLAAASAAPTENKSESEPEQEPAKAKPAPEVNREWEKFEEQDRKWKKKQLYD